MDRKEFLRTGGILASALAPGVLAAAGVDSKRPRRSWKIPPYLRMGDTIGITSPAGHIDEKGIHACVEQLHGWGYQALVGSTIGKQDGSLGGTDDERAADFQKLLDDPFIQAILCARGGYGMVRIIDRLDFTRFLSNPKWLIGFSDITVLHSQVHLLGAATLHSKMCNSFPDDPATATSEQAAAIASIRDALSGKKMLYNVDADPNNRPGSASGPLVGGNLRTLENLSATPSDINTDGSILFVEDVDEYLYSIDRMFWNLKRSGKLAKLKGLVIGAFTVKKSEDPADEFGKDLYQIVLEKVRDYNYPVCFGFPVGHVRKNFALKCGVQHSLEVSAAGATLTDLFK